MPRQNTMSFWPEAMRDGMPGNKWRKKSGEYFPSGKNRELD